MTKNISKRAVHIFCGTVNMFIITLVKYFVEHNLDVVLYFNEESSVTPCKLWLNQEGVKFDDESVVMHICKLNDTEHLRKLMSESKGLNFGAIVGVASEAEGYRDEDLLYNLSELIFFLPKHVRKLGTVFVAHISDNGEGNINMLNTYFSSFMPSCHNVTDGLQKLAFYPKGMGLNNICLDIVQEVSVRINYKLVIRKPQCEVRQVLRDAIRH